MMRVEPCEEDHNVNIVMRNGMETNEDNGEQLETKGWVCKAAKNEVGFDLNGKSPLRTEVIPTSPNRV